MGQPRDAVLFLSARDQQGCPEQDQRGGAVLATSQPHRPRPGRTGGTHQPNRARLDAVLRCVLPFGDLPSPSTHQRLPDALDPQEVQTASGKEESLPLLAGIVTRSPRLFAHWIWLPSVPSVW